MENTSFDQLQTSWREANRRLEEIEIGTVRPWETAHWGWLSPVAHLVVSGLGLLLAGNYLAENWGQIALQPAMGMPAASIYLLGIPTIAASVMSLVHQKAIRSCASVWDAAKATENWERQVVTSSLALLLGGIAFWFLPLFFLLQLAGLANIMSLVHPGWMIANVALGGGIAFGFILFAQPKTRFGQAVRSLLAGDAIAVLKRRLGQIRSFREEA